MLPREYDAAKRHEYYLRTRHLKGRTKKTVSSVPAKKTPVKKTHAQRQKELEARVTALKARLEKLQAVVKQLVEAAQKRSGIEKNTAEKVDATAKYQKQKTADPTSKYEKKTVSEKAAAAKAAQKYRDKNQSLEDQVKDLNNKIKAVRERIQRLQKTGSVGVRKSTTK